MTERISLSWMSKFRELLISGKPNHIILKEFYDYGTEQEEILTKNLKKSYEEAVENAKRNTI